MPLTSDRLRVISTPACPLCWARMLTVLKVNVCGAGSVVAIPDGTTGAAGLPGHGVCSGPPSLLQATSTPLVAAPGLFAINIQPPPQRYLLRRTPRLMHLGQGARFRFSSAANACPISPAASSFIAVHGRTGCVRRTSWHQLRHEQASGERPPLPSRRCKCNPNLGRNVLPPLPSHAPAIRRIRMRTSTNPPCARAGSHPS